MTNQQVTELERKVAVIETKLDTIAEDVGDLKCEMRDHMDTTAYNTEKINAKIDRLIWAVAAGAVAIIIKMVFVL